MKPLSLRLRVPIDVTIVVLVTAIGIAGSVLVHDYRHLRADAAGSAERLGQVLAKALAPDLKLDETWHAYQTLRSLYQGAEPSWLLPSFVLVLDQRGRTLVTSDPSRFPLAQEPPAAGGLRATPAIWQPGQRHIGTEIVNDEWIYRLAPVSAGELPLGTLVLAFPRQALWSRFYDSGLRVLITTGAILLLLLPLGWWVGWRIARPLIELERCVARLGDQSGLPLGCCPTPGPYGELERLRARIQRVAEELREKHALERQMVRSERQAALGRLAAGIAHEINNPLGGMLTAIGMYKRHGQDEAVTRHTISLLERGLDQIRHIVSALLVEVKAESRELSPTDIDDIAELIAAQVREKQLRLTWENGLAEALPLPAGPVRQILLNLALNAVQASPRGEVLAVAVEVRGKTLSLVVTNAGAPIPEERMEHLFEPFAPSDSGGAGLGLWVTDQTVRQLGGEIRATSAPDQTRFEVVLPLTEHS